MPSHAPHQNHIDIQHSTQDRSVNWVETHPDVGVLESRYVRRTDDYIVVYLSSQTGCAKACRMCHLTATGQTKNVDATPQDFIDSAHRVLGYYDQNEAPSKSVHYNFMARGEPLDNQYLIKDAESILAPLAAAAQKYNLLPRYLISTIMPKSFETQSLVDVFPIHHPDLYYSIYSLDAGFRKKWLPLAMPAEDALQQLADWQRHTSKIPKIHYAFIEGENDDVKTVQDICDAVNDYGLRVNVNIVRYNPADASRGREPSENIIARNVKIFEENFKHARIKVHPRVGFDVKASCGMFVNAREN